MDNFRVTWAHCNSCTQKTKHEVLLRKEKTELDDPDDPQGLYYIIDYEVLECRGCGDVSLLRKTKILGEHVDGEDYFPPRVSRRPPPWRRSIDVEYRILMDEIYSALFANSRCLAMMGARAVIDRFLDRHEPGYKSFAEGLARLHEAGYIAKWNVEVLQAAIEAGHAAAHRGHRPDAKQLAIVLDIVESLIQQDVLVKQAEELKNVTPPRPKHSPNPNPDIDTDDRPSPA